MSISIPTGVTRRDVARVCLVMCLLAVLGGCGGEGGEDGEERAAPPVMNFMTVSERPLVMTESLPGRVTALVTAEVRPQVDGIISRRLFEEGGQVEQGQVLYEIDPALYRAAHRTAQASLAEAEAAVTALALRERRCRSLAGGRAVSQQDLETAVSDHAQGRARVARAKAELETAAINLAYTEVRAPVSGRIGASAVTAGALVTARQTDAMAVIQQLDRVYVDISQSSAQGLRLRRAMARGIVSPDAAAARVRLTLEDGSPYTRAAADVEPAEPGAAPSSGEEEAPWIEGELLFSEVLVGETTGSVRLRVVFDNPEHLLVPGMYVTAHLIEGVRPRAILVPQRAVLTDGEGRSFVYVLEDRAAEAAEAAGDATNAVPCTARRRYVAVERGQGSSWLVRSGLAAGDRVAVSGLQKAADGAAVMAVPEADGR